ncbi:MAG: glycosyltransferase family 2 protein, partial [Propionibacteriaceae bacterium]|nr:glycosyltransferase family 2 protein [Propionibacteriaceae bacterium]
SLTVVIPCYRLAERLPLTIASLARAIDERVELLFVDDASPDATAQVIEAALPRLPRARLHRLEQNVGLSGARNAGVALAETDYVTFFDGDDTVARGYFPALLDAIVRLGVPMVRTDYVEVTGRERVLRRVPAGCRDGRIGAPRESILPFGQRTSVDYPYAWAGAYHRSLAEAGLLRFPDELRTAEDRPWIWQLHLGVAAFSVPELVGVHYHRDLPGSLTRLADSTQLDFVAAMEQVVRLVSADAEAERFLPKAVRRWCELTLHHLGRMERFRPEVRRTFRQLLGRSLAGAPQPVLTDTLATLTPDRRGRLTRLLAESHSAPPSAQRRTR